MGGCQDHNAIAVKVKDKDDICRVVSGPYQHVLADTDGVILNQEDKIPEDAAKELAKHSKALKLMKEFYGVELGNSHADTMGVRRMLLIPAEDSKKKKMDWTREDLEFFRELIDGEDTKAGSNNVVLSTNEAQTGIIAVNFADGKRESIRTMILALRKKGKSDERFLFAAETLSRHYVQTWPAAAAGDPEFESYTRVDHLGRELAIAGVGAVIGIIVFAIGGLLSHILIKRHEKKNGKDDDDDGDGTGGTGAKEKAKNGKTAEDGTTSKRKAIGLDDLDAPIDWVEHYKVIFWDVPYIEPSPDNPNAPKLPAGCGTVRPCDVKGLEQKFAEQQKNIEALKNGILREAHASTEAFIAKHSGKSPYETYQTTLAYGLLGIGAGIALYSGFAAGPAIFAGGGEAAVAGTATETAGPVIFRPLAFAF